jgi:Dockerin type I domain
MKKRKRVSSRKKSSFQKWKLSLNSQLSLLLLVILFICLPLFILSTQQQTKTKQFAASPPGGACGNGANGHCADGCGGNTAAEGPAGSGYCGSTGDTNAVCCGPKAPAPAAPKPPATNNNPPGGACGNGGNGKCANGCSGNTTAEGPAGSGYCGSTGDKQAVCCGPKTPAPAGGGNTTTPPGGACGNGANGKCANSCSGNTAPEGPAGSGYCGSTGDKQAVCCGPKTAGTTPAPNAGGGSTAGLACGDNGKGGSTGSCMTACKTGFSAGATGANHLGVCKNLICCSPTAPGSNGTDPTGLACGGNGKGGSSGSCATKCNNGFTGTKTGVCQNLLCCSPNNAPNVPNPAQPAPAAGGQAGAACKYSQLNPNGTTTCYTGKCKAGTACKAGDFNNGCAFAPGVSQQYNCQTGAPIAAPKNPVAPAPVVGGNPAPVTNPNNPAPPAAIAPTQIPLGGICSAIGGTGKCSTNNMGCPAIDLVSDNACSGFFCCLNIGGQCAGAEAGKCVPAAVCGGVGDPKGINRGAVDCPAGSICCHQNPVAAIATHLQGIGNGTTASGAPENASPQTNTVTAVVTAIDDAGGQAAGQTSTGTLTYNPKSGNYESQQFPMPNVAPGNYKLLVHMSNYLNQQVVGTDGSTTFSLPTQTVSSKVLAMLPGDVMPTPQGDNYIDIQDYNTLIGCLANDATACPNPTKVDLNNDGKVDNTDLQLLLDHFGSIGITPTTPRFVCAADPACASVKQTLQMCPMQCKIQ